MSPVSEVVMLAMLLSLVAPALAGGLTDAPIDVGAGLFFNAGGTFMTDARDKTVDGYEVLYSGWGGYGGGGGLALDFRAFSAIGFELDFVYRKDFAQSKFTINDIGFPFETQQKALHVPLLLKAAMPVGVVRPNLFGGPEWVFPGEPSITQPDGFGTRLAVHNQSYRLWTFGLGFEFVPPIPGLDLRIPLSLRGSNNPKIESDAASRADYTISNAGALEEIDFLTTWQWHASITLGVVIYFL